MNSWFFSLEDLISEATEARLWKYSAFITEAFEEVLPEIEMKNESRNILEFHVEITLGPAQFFLTQ